MLSQQGSRSPQSPGSPATPSPGRTSNYSSGSTAEQASSRQELMLASGGAPATYSPLPSSRQRPTVVPHPGHTKAASSPYLQPEAVQRKVTNGAVGIAGLCIAVIMEGQSTHHVWPLKFTITTVFLSTNVQCQSS